MSSFEYLLLVVNDKRPHRCVPVKHGFVRAGAYTVLRDIEAEEMVSDPTVRRMMEVAQRLSNEERPIDYMYAFRKPESRWQTRTIAGRLRKHHMGRALEELQRAPGISAVFPARQPLDPARFKLFVDPGRHMEDFVATQVYGAPGPDEGAHKRLAAEKAFNQHLRERRNAMEYFNNKYKPKSLNA